MYTNLSCFGSIFDAIKLVKRQAIGQGGSLVFAT